MTSLHDFTVRTADGGSSDLSQYAGNVVLVVNVASKCGLTPQLDGLQELYARHRDQGLVVLGFPCNQFSGQMPGTDAEAVTFCRTEYGVDFPILGKIDVNGQDADPLFAWLRSERSGTEGEDIEWNFAKFLIGADGTVLERFAPATEPEDLRGPIESALAAA
ncbi:glutathione peroxidase [Brachybacterium endophyticum]|uniref:Glutathione peroxidase n=1 Tax=Brachybacterium endophyticum TaxID=2182385 RepID=A0A2U2RPH1_9MICO|nr:glutathione peroxidase [Brachybacterium endophyticum]PWH07756.1 glutathione peroxidase [Brachybacterium endophyticum]